MLNWKYLSTFRRTYTSAKSSCLPYRPVWHHRLLKSSSKTPLEQQTLLKAKSVLRFHSGEVSLCGFRNRSAWLIVPGISDELTQQWNTGRPQYGIALRYFALLRTFSLGIQHKEKATRNNENYVITILPIIEKCPNFVTHLDLEKALVV